VVFQADNPFPRALELARLGAAAATFHGSDRIIATAAEKERLRRETGADAVEMESQIIREICRERGLPCAAVRVISDAAQEDLPIDFNAVARPDYSISYLKLAGALGRSPKKLAALLIFHRRLKQSAAMLAGFLGRFLS
jgi:adenosylhomocysteine nucleosidase